MAKCVKCGQHGEGIGYFVCNDCLEAEKKASEQPNTATHNIHRMQCFLKFPDDVAYEYSLEQIRTELKTGKVKEQFLVRIGEFKEWITVKEFIDRVDNLNFQGLTPLRAEKPEFRKGVLYWIYYAIYIMCLIIIAAYILLKLFRLISGKYPLVWELDFTNPSYATIIVFFIVLVLIICKLALSSYRDSHRTQ